MKFKEVLLRELKRRGIEYIFGVPGRENEQILFNEVPGIEYVTTRIEFTAGIAADFSGRMTNKPQVCFSTMGPGATNMTTAVASAMLNKSPLIFFSAQLESDDNFYNTTHQCVNQTKIMEPITKWSYEIAHPQELSQVINKAFKTALTEPVGPVHIAIPVDFFNRDININYDIKKELVQQVITLEVDIDEVEFNNVYQLMKESENPLILIGQEIFRVRAEKSVKKFIELWNIPFIAAANAKGILNFDHPLNYGSASCYMEGILKYKALDDIFEDVDLLICIGYQYVDDLLPKMWTRGREKKIITITSDSLQKTFNKLSPNISVVTNIDKFFTALNQTKTKRKNPKELTEVKKQYKLITENTNQLHEGKLNPPQVINVINKYLDEGILITDIGYYRHHSILLANPNAPQRFFTDTGLSSFGVGLPSAIGAKIYNKDKKVFLICGDGGFHSGSSELATLVKYNLPLIIIVLNNQCFELISLYQDRSNERGNKNIVNLAKIDFVKLAEANGCIGKKITNIKQLEEAIESYDSKHTLVIEVDVIYDENFDISF